MLKALIRKQFMEIFRTYFVNVKTGKARSKGAVIGFFALFAAVMLYICGMFFVLSHITGSALFAAGNEWVYFALMGTIAVVLGLFGSVFNTYASLYLAKDNDFLTAMPIPAKTIILSRVIGVVLLSFLYSAAVWIPSVLNYCLFGNADPAGVIFALLQTVLIAAFVSALTCILGYLVALVSGKLKNKSVITALIAAVFMGGYIFICTRASDLMGKLADVLNAAADSMAVFWNPLYIFGLAASGRILPMLVCLIFTAAIFAGCMYILSRSFFRVISAEQNTEKKAYREKKVKAESTRKALLKKEFRRFLSSPTYMLNGGFGVLLFPAAIVVLAVKLSDVRPLIEFYMQNSRILARVLPVLIPFAAMAVASMDLISAPSVSLEGKNFWILRTMPVSAKDILDAKAGLHVLVNSVPSVIGVIVIGLMLGMEIPAAIGAAAAVWMFVWITGITGLLLGLRNPNFNWVTEATPIKQDMNILLAMLCNFGMLFVFAGFMAVLSLLFGSSAGLIITAVLSAGGMVLFRLVLHTKGVRMFEKL